MFLACSTARMTLIFYFYFSPQSEGARHRRNIDYLISVRLLIQKILSLSYGRTHVPTLTEGFS